MITVFFGRVTLAERFFERSALSRFWTRGACPSDTRVVESARLVSERSLEELLWLSLSARAEGLVVLRDRDGLRHGVWVHGGFVVGVHVAGRFDPLLDLLRKRGALDVHAYRVCIDQLWRTGARSGAIAMDVAFVPRQLVREALRQQTCERLEALLEIAASRGHDACLEPRAVPHAEVSVRMPLGAVLRGAPSAIRRAPEQPSREEARRQLRSLAKRLHPDRNAHLDPETQKALERDLARATAAYHGFAS